MRRFMNCLMYIFVVMFVCSCSYSDIDEGSKLKIGVTWSPHGEILENIRNIFDLDFEIINYYDYDLLNKDLLSGKLDGNFFQTREYFEHFNSNNKNPLVEVAKVHIEPLVIYSKKYKDLSLVDDGSIVHIPSDFVNRNRALALLEDSGLIKYELDLTNNTYNIIENNKNLVINEVEVNIIPSLYNDNLTDVVVLNTNFALENSILPYKEGIFVEKVDFENNLNENLLVTRKDMATSIKLKEIGYYLNTYETFKFINERYRGFVKPVF